MTTIQHGLQHKLVHTTISKGLAPRQFKFVISSESVDRDRDVIRLDAWDVREYMANPVVLASHDHQRLPVGKSVDIGVRGDKLKATVEFPPKGIYDYADTVHDLVEAGFLKAASVGFRADQSEPNDHGGMTIKRATLLEWSICAIGSNPDAMVERSAPLVMRKWLQSKQQFKKEDAMYLELDDEPYLELKDSWDDMLAQLRRAAEADQTFSQLMLHQISTLGRLASIDDLVSALASRGTATPRSLSWYDQARNRVDYYHSVNEREQRARDWAAAKAAPSPVARSFARIG